MFPFESTKQEDEVYPQGIYKIKLIMNYHFEEDVPYLVSIDNGNETVIGMVSPSAWKYVKAKETFTEDKFYIGDNCIFYGAEAHKCQIQELRHRHRRVVYVFVNKLQKWL